MPQAPLKSKSGFKCKEFRKTPDVVSERQALIPKLQDGEVFFEYKNSNMCHNFAQWKIVFFCRKDSSQNATLKAKLLSHLQYDWEPKYSTWNCQLLRTLSTVWKTPLALFRWGNLLTHLRAESDSSLPVEGDAIPLLCYIKIWALNPSPLRAFSWALLQCSALNGKEKPKRSFKGQDPFLGASSFCFCCFAALSALLGS